MSTLDGVKRFAASNDPPPADWLYVFDSTIRYAKPSVLWDMTGEKDYFEPFAAYGLDCDVVPPKVDPEDYYTNREVRRDAWDGFVVAPIDRKNLDVRNLPAFRGYGATHVPNLPVRLSHLAQWICKVSDQPAAVWWASGQLGIHPELQISIRLQFERGNTTHSPEIRRAWRYIFEAWENQANVPDIRRYHLEASVKLDGWTNAAVRQLAKLSRPRLVVKRAWNKPWPTTNPTGNDIRDIVQLDVEYPNEFHNIQIQSDCIVKAVKEIRKNLEHAISLEIEIGGQGLSLLAPIETDQNLQGISSGRGRGLSGALLFYVSLFKKLIELDPAAAKQESLSWPVEDDTLFAALRIWASGDARIYSGDEAGATLGLLNAKVFWHSRYRRDLMLVLLKRWSDYPGLVKKKLAERLLNGPPQWDGEQIAEYEERRSWESLNRVEWLRSQGGEFDFDVDAEIVKLRQHAPKWRPEYAEKATASMEPRSGWVRTDTEYDAILDVPLDKILDTATSLKGRDHEMFVERNPFAGLASHRPVRALSTLTVAGRRGDYPSWAWRDFLNEGANKSKKPKFLALVAERVSRLPVPVLADNVHPLCDWLLNSSPLLLRNFPAQYYQLWRIVLSVIESDARISKSPIVKGDKEPDWPMEGLNSPVGKLAQALMNDPDIDARQNGSGLPLAWIDRASKLLSLDGDLRRCALVIFSSKLNWLYQRDRVWTEKNLLSCLAADSHDQDSFWAGVFWARQIRGKELFLRLKSPLLTLAKMNSVTRPEYGEVLAGYVLVGWGSVDSVLRFRLVGNEEFRDVLITANDDFRSHVLLHLGHWCSDAQDGDKNWANEIPEFLTHVWPIQKSAKTPRMTARLCDLAFSNAASFAQTVDLVLPLVTKLNEAVGHDLVRLEEVIARRHPERTLALLSSVLPENASGWPYGIESILDEIEKSDSPVLKDSRLIELRRRLNSR